MTKFLKISFKFIICWVRFVKVITIRLPEAVVREIDILIEIGRYSSRAEVIREAIRDLVRKEFNTARSQLRVIG